MNFSRILLLSLMGVCAVTCWVIVDRPQSGLLERTWPAVGAVDGGFLQFAGVHDDFNTNVYTYYNDLYFFSNLLQRYVELHPIGPIPAPRAFSSGVGDASSGCLYIYGGANYPPSLYPATIYNDFWVYCIDDNEWVELNPRTQGPGARTGSSLTLVNNKIYLFGGLDAQFQGHNDLWEYNIRSNRWTQIIPANLSAPMPVGQHLAIFQYYQGNFYVGYGERGIQVDFGFATGLWKFNLNDKTWTALSPNPDLEPTRNYVGNVIYGAYIILLGGDTPSSEPPCCGAPFPQNPTNETAVYSIVQNKWTIVDSPLPDMPNLKRHRLVLNGDTIHAVGGWGWIQNVGQIWNPNVYAALASDIVARSIL
jgi:hypothetical protein